MAGNVTLSAGVRQNLLSLQNTASMMSVTQNRLATGKKVNTALDNPTNFFTAYALSARSKDLSNLLDAMSNGIKTLETADNGLTSITKNLESMQSTLRQARQDKSFQTESFEFETTDTWRTVAFATDADKVGSFAAAHSVTLNSLESTGFDVANVENSTITIGMTDDNGGALDSVEVNIKAGDSAKEIANKINNALRNSENGSQGIRATIVAGEIRITASSLRTLTIASVDSQGVDNLSDFGLGTGTVAAAADDASSVDELVAAINADTIAAESVRASNNNGKLRIENLSTTALAMEIQDSLSAQQENVTIGGNQVRKNLADQFNELRDQLDKLSDDSSFNGINLLRGDKLTITFNEIGTSTIEIQTKNGEAITAARLGLSDVSASELDKDDDIDTLLTNVAEALNTIRSQSSAFGSNLSIVENRTSFTKMMMNTLQTGGDALVLADTNEEGANMLSLQTRQQLSSTALSLASQADQTALRLFG
ncbi:flagellin [Chthonobacter albigriseus]|uniref:flagellin N-terminal helical domain-containing protein n=1 Tax=Chthonobacter albigriseus TaxID=1683161 RepID=UPI0015EFBB5D|nr:flagellin [Chthonobacter albigriseus]